MTALYIVLGIAAFFTLLAFLRLTLILDAEEEAVLDIKVLFLRFRVRPRKKKSPKLKRFRIRRFRRERRKEEKRYRKKELAKQEAARKKAMAEADAENKIKPKKSLRENVAYGMDVVKYVVLRVLKRFGRHLRVDIYRIAITVACGEPDQTAITYGYVCQGVAYVKAILEQHLRVRYPEKGKERITVGVDYLSGKSEFRVHMAFHIRVWQVVAIGITALKGYLTMPRRESTTNSNDTSSPKDDPTKTPSVPTPPSNQNRIKTPATAGKEA